MTVINLKIGNVVIIGDKTYQIVQDPHVHMHGNFDGLYLEELNSDEDD